MRPRALLLKAARKALAVADLDLVRASRQPWPSFIRRITDMKIDLVIDVGANAGQYGQLLRRSGYLGEIISFEPLAEAYSRLQAAADRDPKWNCRNLALGDQPGHATINISANSASSSLLRVEPEIVRQEPIVTIVGTETIRIDKLDSQMSSLGLEARRPLLKIDVQGFEDHVLSGASNTLPKLRLLQMEMSLIPCYTGEALVADHLSRLRDFGFQLVDIQHGFRLGDMRLVQIDGLFINTAFA